MSSSGVEAGTVNKQVRFRVGKIDIKKMDLELDMAMKRWSAKKKKPKEEWEIDLSTLELKYVISNGTYGTMHRGTYGDKDVVVKVLDLGEDASAEATVLRSSFQQQAALLHKIGHPNITNFIGASMGDSPTSSTTYTDVAIPPKAWCLVAEYLPGGTLKRFLIRNRRKKLPFKTVIQMALDMARGLEYLHSKKIVHRDVKTENMLLDSRTTVKFAGFDLARVEAENEMTGVTGTLGYMAPEVVSNKPYNHKCDVYSFGICLWEIYCCEMPYPDMSLAKYSSTVVEGKLRPRIPKCCPRSLAKIMKRCWDDEAEKRPDMAEVVRRLEAINTTKGGGMIPDDEAPSCFCFRPSRGP